MVFRDGPRLIKALYDASPPRLRSWHFAPHLVRYLDALGEGELPGDLKEKEVFFCKHARWFYQGEFRVVWLAPGPVGRLEHIELEVKDLPEYAELLAPEQASTIAETPTS